MMVGDEGIEEIFVIKTKYVNFFGALVKMEHGLTSAHGSVRFDDGKEWYFQIPANDRLYLRKKLESLCGELAAVFNVDFLHQKFQNVIAYDQFAAMCNTRVQQ